MLNNIQNVSSWAKVYFYTPGTVKNMDKDHLNIRYIKREDITNISVTTSVNDTTGSFSISLINNNLIWLEGDDTNQNILDLVQLGYNETAKRREQTKKDWSSSKPYEAAKVIPPDGTPMLFTYYRSEKDFQNFRYEYYKVGDKKYRIYSDITANDLKRATNDENNPLNNRHKRWFFEQVDGKEVVRIVTVTVDSANPNIVKYFLGTKDITEFVEVHTNKELYDKDKFGGSTLKTHPKIHPMDYVFIFMATDLDEKGNPKYHRVFTGVVNKVTFSRKNQDTMTIEGEDITKILRLSAYAVEKALLNESEISGEDGVNLLWESIFAGKSADEIVAGLIKDIQKGLTPNKVEQIDTTLGNTTASLQTLQEKTFSEEDLKLTNLINDFYAINSVFIEKIPQSNPELANVDQFTPYKEIFGAKIPMYQTEYKDRLQLCREVAQIMGFEFFADPDGYIHYRQPRFDLANLFLHKDPMVYVCDSQSMRSYSVSEDDSHVVSLVRVTGSFDILGSSEELETYANYTNPQMVSKYGARFFDATSPLVATPGQCRTFAKSLMRRTNADKVNAQVELNLRPALRAGNPVYIPELNQVYYVSTVTHTFSYGGECTTSIGLQYGRPPWDVLPELLSFYSTDKADSGVYGNAPAVIVPTPTTKAFIRPVNARMLTNIMYVKFYNNVGIRGDFNKFDFMIEGLGKTGRIRTGSQWYPNLLKVSHKMAVDGTRNTVELSQYGDYNRAQHLLNLKQAGEDILSTDQSEINKTIHVGIWDDIRINLSLPYMFAIKRFIHEILYADYSPNKTFNNNIWPAIIMSEVGLYAATPASKTNIHKERFIVASGSRIEKQVVGLVNAAIDEY